MSLITSIVFLILGIFLVFRTEGTINLISSIIGVILLLNGGFTIIKYFQNESEFKSNVELICGIAIVIAGFVLILNPVAVVSILPFILGIYFTITGIIKLKYALDIRKYQKENPIFMLITSGLTIVCGLLFVINPFGGAVALTQMIGIFMIVYSCLDILNYIFLRKDLKTIEKLWK